VEEDSVVVVFMVVVLVADTSAAEEAGLDRLEAEAVSEAGASTRQPRCSVVRADPLEWERAGAESAWAERASQVEFQTLLAQDPAFLHLGILHLGSLSIMDDLANSQLRPFAGPQRLIGRRTVSAQHAMVLGNGRR
jgi:hypothetical protein